jgi:alkanesulfonate monooxygenase SsuD/methylene tetrahydromethanopterin reductase-like flavin-dependent oxidoreductase (luciferase family)
VFGPLPEQGANVPVWLGGRDERALRRVGRLADAYHASATAPGTYAERVPVIAAAAEAAGRPMPRLSARVRIEQGAGAEPFHTIHGSPEACATGIQAYEELGVDHLALAFRPRDAAGLRAAVQRFVTEVRPLV